MKNRNEFPKLEDPEKEYENEKEKIDKHLDLLLNMLDEFDIEITDKKELQQILTYILKFRTVILRLQSYNYNANVIFKQVLYSNSCKKENLKNE